MKYPNIEAERAKVGVDKKTFASMLGIDRKTYFNWQKYGNIPSTKLELMADLFGCTVDYLLNNPCGVQSNKSA